MTTDFWIGFGVGVLLAGPAGFVIAAMLAASGRASRLEESWKNEIRRIK